MSGGTVSGTIEGEYGIAVLYKNTKSNPSSVYPVHISSSIDDGSNYYLDTIGITLTAEYADSASYEASTGETGTFTGSTRINVGEGVAVGDSVTVKVKGTNSRGTYEKTFTYYKQDLDIDQCVFFKNSKNWVRANAYVFGEDASGETTETLSGWSGVPMFEYAEDTDGTMIYAVEIPEIEKYNSVIFNNNIAELQTSLGSYGQMYDSATGNWSQYLEPGAGKAKVTASLDSATIVGEKEITFTVTNADSAVYSFNGGAETAFTDSITLKVGSDLAEGESDTVKIVATKGEKVTEKIYTYTMGENKPILSISPETETTFTDVLDVVITAENVVECTYQINDGEPQSFTETKTIVIGEGCEVGDTVEITVYGKSSNGKESTQKAVYVKKAKSEHYYIFFKNTSDWATVSAYVWQDSTQTSLAGWPGTAMTVYDAANKIYMLDLGAEPVYDHIIFSNNGASQTGDLALGSAGQLYDGSSWSDYFVTKTPTISTTLESGEITAATQVTYTVEDALQATYKVDSAEAAAFEDKVTIAVGEGLKAGETQTVVIKAVNGDEAAIKVYTYEMKSDSVVTPTVTVSPTPIDSVTPTPTNTVTPTPTVEPTPDLTDVPTVTPTIEPTITIGGTVTPTPTTEPIKERVVVHFKSDVDNVSLFYQNKSDTANRNVWNEAAMIAGADGWFTYTIESSTRAKVYCVAGDVTTDQYTLEEGEWWYADESWNAENPDKIITTITPTETPTATPVVTEGVTITPTITVTEVPTATVVPTATMVPTVTETPTTTVTMTPTVTETPTATITIVPTMTETPTVTVTAIPTVTTVPDITITTEPTATQVPEETVTPTPTVTPEPTITKAPEKTVTPKPTAAPTQVPTPTKTATATPTPQGGNSTVITPLPKGEIYIDEAKNAVYQVTKSGAKNGTVTYMMGEEDAKGTITIPATVKISGITYKVTAIDDNAFEENTELTKVVIGKNVVTIGKNAFYGCSNLKTVKMGANVKTISDKAFYKCTSLTKITIPSKVAKIGKSAFYGCKKLKTITIKTTKLTKKNVGSNAWKGIYSKANIKVPKSKVTSYKKLLKSKGVGSKAKIKKY